MEVAEKFSFDIFLGTLLLQIVLSVVKLFKMKTFLFGWPPLRAAEVWGCSYQPNRLILSWSTVIVLFGESCT